MSIFDETLTMNNGLKIPKMVLGVWKIPDDQQLKKQLRLDIAISLLFRLMGMNEE